MCGIAGFIDFNERIEGRALESMVNSLHHRGPDDNGSEIFKSDHAIIGFGQARLSIIDLSHGGHQPMHFKELTLVFNGEIYNYLEIKQELISLGHTFSSNSDTEVILHAYDQWGLEAVHRFIGMFVFVIYDSEKNRVTITRDRAGVKPLYYSFVEGLLLFASELKALMAHPRFNKEIAKEVLPDYLHYGYIPAPHSIFKDTYKLQAGHHLVLELESQNLSIDKYWDASDYFAQPKLTLSYVEAKEELHDLLRSACQYRMVADVPVGVFLSGGYDSTAVTAILQSHSQEKLKTFTIGFEEGNNEAPFAKETAAHLGTDHSEYYCTTQEAQDLVREIAHYFDEPFGDSSAIPTMLVSKKAREKVTVALSADAGDELFFGYNSYFQQTKNLQKLRQVPNFLKPYLSSLSPWASNLMRNEAKAHKVSSFLASLHQDPNEEASRIYYYARRKPSHYIDQFFSHGQNTDSKKNVIVHRLEQPEDGFMLMDYQDYLQNDILTKVDRATMSVSLEGREPLLDHRLLEFAARLPLEFKYTKGAFIGKNILRDIVHEYVPKEMMERPKAGFSIPVLHWLRNDLVHLQKEFLSEEALAWSGLWNVPFVLSEVKRFNQGKLHYGPIIWYIVVFQMWYKRWIHNS